MDDGNIIAQKAFQIKFTDTIKNVYSKAVIVSQEILLATLKNIDKVIFIPQDKPKIEVFPQSFPEDGEINWHKSALEIYNFIRAQTLPYPCAFSNINGMQIKFIDAKIIKNNSKYFPNGMIVNINNKACIATNDKFLQIGRVLYEGKRYKFTDFTRTYNLWGDIQEQEFLRLLLKVYELMFTVKKAKLNRTLPFCEYFVDRIQKARKLGFGEGTTIYG